MTHYVNETFVKKAGKESLRASGIVAIVVAVLAAYAEYNGEDVPDKPNTDVVMPAPATLDPGTIPANGNMGEPENVNLHLHKSLDKLTTAMNATTVLKSEYLEFLKEQDETLRQLNAKSIPAIPMFPNQMEKLIDEGNTLREALKKANKPKPYTGIKVHVPNPRGVLDGTDTSCPPCVGLVQGILIIGSNWTVGTTAEYTFWLVPLSKEKGVDGYPVFEVVVNGVVKDSWVGYDWKKGKSELYKVLNRHPKVKEK